MSDQMRFDDRDRKILELLQRDCRISNADLAERAGMSASACWRRVKAFEDAVWETPVATVSPPVKTQFGYHLIWVHERDEDL